jgi:lipoate-protein ligase B
MEYQTATLLQRRLLRKRMDKEMSDMLLLLEHPPTITIGKSGGLDHVLVPPEELSKENISLFFTDRGGNVTYHGPGQLVGYPILNLKERNRDIHKYVRDLEEVILKTLNSFGITANRKKNHAGVWVNEEQIASIGLSIRKWFTMHGFALNVKPKLGHFLNINPCGILGQKATSIVEILAKNISMETVTKKLINFFSEVFDVQVELAAE